MMRVGKRVRKEGRLRGIEEDKENGCVSERGRVSDVEKGLK